MILGYNTIRNKNKLINDLLITDDVEGYLCENLFKRIGSGSHRKCYALNSNWVIKVSIENQPGCTQNNTEISTYNIVSTDDRFSTIRKYFAKIHPASTEKFVIMQRVDNDSNMHFRRGSKIFWNLYNTITKYGLLYQSKSDKIKLYEELKNDLPSTKSNKVFLEFLLLESLTGARIITDMVGYGNTIHIGNGCFKIVDYGYCDTLSRYL